MFLAPRDVATPAAAEALYICKGVVPFLRNNIHPAARINGLYYWTDDGRGRGEGTTLPEEGREVKDGKKIHSLSLARSLSGHLPQLQ